MIQTMGWYPGHQNSRHATRRQLALTSRVWGEEDDDAAADFKKSVAATIAAASSSAWPVLFKTKNSATSINK